MGCLLGRHKRDPETKTVPMRRPAVGLATKGAVMDWFRVIGAAGLVAVSGGAGWVLHAATTPAAAEVARPGPAARVPLQASPGVQAADDKPLIMVASDGQVTLRVEQQPLEWVLEQIAQQSGLRHAVAAARAPMGAASGAPANECPDPDAPNLLPQQQVRQLLQAIRNGSEQERIDGLLQAREAAVPLGDDTLKTLFETDASEQVRLRAFEAYLEGRSGNVDELRSALQAAQYVPSAAIQAEAKAQLQQLQDIERIDAASPQQSDP